jgi:hypothetical protein
MELRDELQALEVSTFEIEDLNEVALYAADMPMGGSNNCSTSTSSTSTSSSTCSTTSTVSCSTVPPPA